MGIDYIRIKIIKIMIPKIIHYCWFGGNPLPPLAIKCIESWKRFFPDYEIKEWNESNFDVNIIPYTAEAYRLKKYAFVSDFARFWILYNYGGLYFDTDVEVIKNMDDIIAKGPFMGCENGVKIGATPNDLGVNPGLGLGVTPNLSLYREMLDIYKKMNFLDDHGHQIKGTVVTYTTNLLVERGLNPIDDVQYVEGIWIYPKEYFCPKDYNTGKMYITEESRSIHHYDSSWLSIHDKVKKRFINLIGPKLTSIFVTIKQFTRLKR